MDKISIFLRSDIVFDRLSELLGKNKAIKFRASLLSIINNNSLLQKASPNSIYAGAIIAASLDLPINQLGYAYLVPYKGEAQLQIGYKGFIQLALRSGQVKVMTATPIYDGQLISWNPLKEELLVDFSEKSQKIAGYASYAELLNGFTKTIYLTADEINAHRDRYSISFKADPTKSVWGTHPIEMALKTVMKKLCKFVPLSTEMDRAMAIDQAVVRLPEPKKESSLTEEMEEMEVIYIDSPDNQVVTKKLPVLTPDHPAYEKSFSKPLEALKEIFVITDEYEQEYHRRQKNGSDNKSNTEQV